MDQFKCFCEITANKRNGLLQQMSSDNRVSFNLYMPGTKEVS